MVLRGGSIKDLLNEAIITLPEPAQASTGGVTIAIDEVLPTITSQKAGLGGTSVVIGFPRQCLEVPCLEFYGNG